MEEKKPRRKKKNENEDIERRRVGTCVVEKKLRGKKKSFWVVLNSLKITKILINFKIEIN